MNRQPPSAHWSNARVVADLDPRPLHTACCMQQPDIHTARIKLWSQQLMLISCTFFILKCVAELSSRNSCSCQDPRGGRAFQVFTSYYHHVFVSVTLVCSQGISSCHEHDVQLITLLSHDLQLISAYQVDTFSLLREKCGCPSPSSSETIELVWNVDLSGSCYSSYLHVCSRLRHCFIIMLFVSFEDEQSYLGTQYSGRQDILVSAT